MYIVFYKIIVNFYSTMKNFRVRIYKGNWKTLKAGTTETENGNGKGKKSAHAQ